ncbi:hypothetical protein P7C70_g7740, partial [Phenoliferia sp. Uapishka_3]
MCCSNAAWKREEVPDHKVNRVMIHKRWGGKGVRGWRGGTLRIDEFLPRRLSFFVFFTFKSWKRLLLADAPRQVINGLTLYSFGASVEWTTDISTYFSGSLAESFVIITMLFSVVVWVGSTILLLIAAIIYVPLLCYIQGNLKEYCCHKVDKRIEELMKRKTRKRLAKEAAIARKEAKGDYSHLKDKTGKFRAAPMQQPTLPSIALDDDQYSQSGFGSDAGSIYGGRDAYQYPPPVSNAGWGPPGRQGGAPYAPSALSRTGYPYQTSSDGLSSSNHYAESVHSVDALATHAAPMGHFQGAGLQRHGTNGSQTPTLRSLEDRERERDVPAYSQHAHSGSQSSAVSYPSALRHQPSYASMHGAGGFIPDRKGAGSPSPSQLSYGQFDFGGATGGGGLSRQDSLASGLGKEELYYPGAPSQRDQLYERTTNAARGSDMSLGYMQDELGSLVSGGWENTRTKVVAQEYDDRWEKGAAGGEHAEREYHQHQGGTGQHPSG